MHIRCVCHICDFLLAFCSNYSSVYSEILLHNMYICCCSIHLLELTTCWDSTVRKRSQFQMPLENPSVQTHLVLLCCIKCLCFFGPKDAIQIRYYYYYYYFTPHIVLKSNLLTLTWVVTTTGIKIFNFIGERLKIFIPVVVTGQFGVYVRNDEHRKSEEPEWCMGLFQLAEIRWSAVFRMLCLVVI